ncbi:MAG: ferritin family protein [Candidatus Diapherotrites archaeon]|nr:ferritin family protein [Candidatus Diapherotrites archaeon]
MESNAGELVKGMEIALGFEKEFMKFYSEKALTAKNASLKKLFLFLAEQEKTHETVLEKIKKMLKEKGKWSNEDISLLAKNIVPSFESFLVNESQQKRTILEENEVDLILWAMRAEKRAKEFYAELKEKAEGNEGKAFFEQMSEFENQHFELLDKLMEKLTENYSKAKR